MPALTLPMMTITPNRVISNVMPASTSRWVGPVLLELPVVIKTPCEAGPAVPQGPASMLRSGLRPASRSVSRRGKEAGILHQRLVTLLLGLDPFGVVSSGQEGRVESAAFHEVLPFGRGADLLEQLDVIFDLVLGGPRRHEDAAQHQVFDVEALRLAGGNVLPALAVGDLLVIGHRLRVEYAERAQLAAAPLRDRLDRIVDGRIDMVADQLNRDFAAALVGNVGELGAGHLFDADRDDLVFLLGSGAAHLE